MVSKNLNWAWIVTAALFCTFRVFAAEVGGVEVPEQLQTEQGKLYLNGSGVRTKFMMDIYVGSLYLNQKQKDADTIIAGDKPMAVRLDIVSALITNEKMQNAAREAFNNATDGNTAPIQTKLDDYLATFADQIEQGDRFEFVYGAEQELKIYKNDQYLKSIKGLDFKKALFGTWLGAKPSQESLKQAMLGM